MKESELIQLLEESIRNSLGAYNALKLIGAQEYLPGLKSCESKAEEALQAIKKYKKQIK